jgi:hypothetical protein
MKEMFRRCLWKENFTLGKRCRRVVICFGGCASVISFEEEHENSFFGGTKSLIGVGTYAQMLERPVVGLAMEKRVAGGVSGKELVGAMVA